MKNGISIEIKVAVFNRFKDVYKVKRVKNRIKMDTNFILVFQYHKLMFL